MTSRNCHIPKSRSLGYLYLQELWQQEEELQLQEEELKTQDPEFWNDPKSAELQMKKIRGIKTWLTSYNEIVGLYGDTEVLFEFAKEGEAEESEVDEHFDRLQELVEALELKNMLSEEEDSLSAVLQITAGAGGTESCDWASMLMRMYTMWAQKNGYKLKELNYQDGDVAGIKTVTLELDGEFAFGYLKGENGVHRLVRISPFDSKLLEWNKILSKVAFSPSEKYFDKDITCISSGFSPLVKTLEKFSLSFLATLKPKKRAVNSSANCFFASIGCFLLNSFII